MKETPIEWDESPLLDGEYLSKTSWNLRESIFQITFNVLTHIKNFL